MTPDYSRIWPWIFAVLIPLMVYRRLRRSFGRQVLRPTRMTVRMIILAALGASLAPAALRSAGFLTGEAAGAVFGAGLALWGAKRTRFRRQDDRLYYVPHTYAGIAISLLVAGRIAYRLTQVYSATGFVPPGAGSANSSPAAPGLMVQSPLTVGILFVLIGYYLCYYGWLLWKSKHIAPGDLEASTVPPDAAQARSDVTHG